MIVLGLSNEIIVKLPTIMPTASREQWCGKQLASRGHPQDHPQSCTAHRLQLLPHTLILRKPEEGKAGSLPWFDLEFLEAERTGNVFNLGKLVRS